MRNSTFRYVYAGAMLVLVLAVLVRAELNERAADQQLAVIEEFNHDCVVNYDLEGEPVRPEEDRRAGTRARRAAAGLLDLESDYFEIRADCINRYGKDRSRLTVQYVVLDSSGWSRNKLIDASRQVNTVLGQCGIYLNDIAVNMVAVDSRYDTVDSIEYFQLVNATRQSSDITLYFINEQAVVEGRLWGLAYNQNFSRWYELRPKELKRYADTETISRPGLLDNIALIVGNHTRRGQSSYAWRTQGLGRTIAHELYHILGDCGCHEKSDRGNFMFPGGGYSATRVTPTQCDIASSGISRLRALENNRIMTFDPL